MTRFFKSVASCLAVLALFSLGTATMAAPAPKSKEAARLAWLAKVKAAKAKAAKAKSAAKPKAKHDPEAFVVKRVLDIRGPMKYGQWVWDDSDVPPGPIVVTVDLQARVISVFQGGYEIGAAVAMLGTPEHPTPTGIFPILKKDRHNVSEKYNNAPMPWSLFLTWSGVAIHGGSEVENGYASHGCVAIPDELAARLFAKVKVGDKVIITDGKSLDVGGKLL